MPGFHIHISASTTMGIAYGGIGCVAFGVPPSTAALSTVLCSVSGMLPDLDSGPGRPLHESVCFAAAAIPMMMADRFKHLGWDHESIILAGAMIYLFIRFGLGEMLKKCTVHRGIFHSLPVALIFAELGFLVCTTGNLDARYYKAGAIVLGFMSHLILDEIWSVDFRHMKLKSSFGTAVKLWAPSHWATAVAYSIAIVTTLLALNDPIWSTASVEERELHAVAQRVVGGFEQESTRIEKVEQPATDGALR